MSTQPTSLAPSENRAIPLRRRLDLHFFPGQFQGDRSWIVKDPLAMKYFQLRPPEYRILQKLDGSHSYREIKTMLDREFPESRFQMEAIQGLVHQFHQMGLLKSPHSGQATPLQRRRQREIRQKTLGLLSSIIALRFPGVDPDAFLSWLYPKTQFLFTRVALVLSLTLMISALALVGSNYPEFASRLPEFQQFFGLNNLLLMGCLLILTKSIHELGHGLTCKHFGGECHEIGFMLLVMTPAMYCNTSDSWILPNKWHRMAIGAGGMYFELILASICTFVYWYTQPGVIHYVCLNVMFLSSVSTVIFNANPLLRYDGYFILSDFLEIPNLSQKANQSLLSRLRTLALGMKATNSRFLPQKNRTTFALFSVASFLYRWFVVFSIYWFLFKIFEPYNLEIVALLIVTLSLVGSVFVPLFKLGRFFAYPGRLREVKSNRAFLSIGLLTFLLGFFFFVPLPFYVWADFVIRPENAQHVFVQQAGVLNSIHCSAREKVEAGQVLARFSNPELKLAQLELEREQARKKAELFNYQLNLDRFADAGAKILELQSEIDQLDEQLATLGRKLNLLTLRADRDGTVLCPPNLPGEPEDDQQLAGWHGLPLDTENLGAYFLAEGELFCFIGDPDSVKAILVVDQSDAPLLRRGQSVDLMLHLFPGQRFTGNVSLLSQEAMTSIPRELSKSNGGPIAMQTRPNGNEIPLINSYETEVALDPSRLPVRNGYRGKAKILVGHRTLASRTWRYLSKIIRFR